MPTDISLGPIERALALRRLHAFETLSASNLALLSEQLRARHFRRGALLSSPGLPLDALSFVMHGSVTLSYAARPPERLGPRQVLGDIASLLCDSPAPHAIAEDTTLTLELRRAQLEDVFDDEFQIFVAVLRSMANALLRAGTITLSGPAPTTARAATHALARPLGLVDRVVLLRRTMDFAGTEIGPLADLAQHATELSLPAATPLWQIGERADHLMIIVSGLVAVHTRDGDAPVFGPGSTLGAVESLAFASRMHSATTRTEVHALRIPTAAALDLIEDNMDVGISLLGVLARAIGHPAC